MTVFMELYMTRPRVSTHGMSSASSSVAVLMCDMQQFACQVHH